MPPPDGAAGRFERDLAFAAGRAGFAPPVVTGRTRDAAGALPVALGPAVAFGPLAAFGPLVVFGPLVARGALVVFGAPVVLGPAVAFGPLVVFGAAVTFGRPATGAGAADGRGATPPPDARPVPVVALGAGPRRASAAGEASRRARASATARWSRSLASASCTDTSARSSWRRRFSSSSRAAATARSSLVIATASWRACFAAVAAAASAFLLEPRFAGFDRLSAFAVPLAMLLLPVTWPAPRGPFAGHFHELCRPIDGTSVWHREPRPVTMAARAAVDGR